MGNAVAASGASKQGKFHYGHVVFVACCLITFGPVAFIMGITGQLFTPVGEVFGMGPGVASYVDSVMFLTMALTLPIWGKVFANRDARLCLTVAVGLLIIGLTVNALFLNLVTWYLFYGVCCGGACAMLLHIMGSTLMNRWFAKGVGWRIGVIAAMLGAGGVVWNPVMAGLIASHGVQSVLALEAGLSIVLGLLPALLLVRSRPEDMGLLRYGLDASQVAAAEAGETHDIGMGLDAKAAFSSKAFIMLAITAFVLNLTMFALTMNASFIRSLPASAENPLLAGTVTSVFMFGQMVAKIVLGAIGDKNLRVAWCIGFVAGLIGFFGYINFSDNIALIYVFAVFIGIYIAMSNVLLPVTTRAFFGQREYVHIYARLSTIVVIACMLQAPIWGTVADFIGFRVMYMFMFGIALINFFVMNFSLSFGKEVKEKWTEGVIK